MNAKKLLCLVILLIPFQFYFNVFGNLSVSVAQVLGIGMVLWLIADMIRQRSVRLLTATAMHGVVLLFMTAMAVAMLGADDRMVSLKYCLKWWSSIALFFVAYRVPDSKDSQRQIVICMMIAAAASAAIGITEAIAGWEKVLNWFRSSPLAGFLMEPDTLKEKLLHGTYNWTTNDGNRIVLRAFGTCECAIEYAGLLGLVLPFFYYFLHVSGSRRQLIPVSLGGMAVIVAMALSYTRSGLFILGIVTLLFFIFALRDGLARYIVRGAAVVVLLVAIVSAAYPLFLQTYEGRLKNSIAGTEQREVLWRSGVIIFKNRPVTGVGPANYGHASLKYVDPLSPPLPSHNEYLQVAAETGIIGLMLYLLILFCGIRYSLLIIRKASSREDKYWGLAFLGMWIGYCGQSFFFDPLFADKFAMVFWILAGLNARLYLLTVQPSPPSGLPGK